MILLLGLEAEILYNYLLEELIINLGFLGEKFTGMFLGFCSYICFSNYLSLVRGSLGITSEMFNNFIMSLVIWLFSV